MTLVAHIWLYGESSSYPEVGRISDLMSFEPDIVSVQLDGKQLRRAPGQNVIPHGPITTAQSRKCSTAT